MPFDIRKLIEMAPLIVGAMKPGSPEAAAMMRGFMRAQQQRRQQGMEDQQLQEQRAVRESQMANMSADNRRADEALQMQREQAGFQREQAGIGRLEKFREAAKERANELIGGADLNTSPADPGLQNQISLDQFNLANQYGVPGAQSTTLPNVSAPLSMRKKRRAKELYEEAKASYAPKDDKGNVTDHAWEDSITLNSPEFGDMKPSQLRVMFATPAYMAQGGGSLRPDGTTKGNGFLGPLQRPDGRVSSEISIGVNVDGREMDIPTLVPTLTPQERQWLLTNDNSDPRAIPQPIVDKAVAHARKRLASGLSPFADGGQPGRVPAPFAQPPDREASTPGSFDAQFVDMLAAEEERLKRKLTRTEKAQLRLRAKGSYEAAGRPPKEGDEPIQPDDVLGAATAILSGRMAPSQLSLVGGMGNRGVKFKQAVVAEVNKRDPNFNWQASEAGYKFASNPGTQNTIRFLDNIEKTLPVLERASDDFKRSNVQVINKAILAGKKQFGSTDVVTFEFARNILADEIAKILQGGGTGNGTSDAKLRQAQDLISGDMTPDQLKAAIGAARELLSTRRESLSKGTFMEKKPGTTGPKIGERRTFDGKIGEWDGKGWKAVQ
jgi:hypothetical protein